MMSNGKKIIILLIFIAGVFYVLQAAGIRYGLPGVKRNPVDMNGAMLMDLPPAEGKPIFIMFYSDSCSICNKLRPDINKFHKELGDKALFLLINTDVYETKQIATDFKVEGLPTFYWITVDRKVFDKKAGGWPAKEIRNTIIDLIDFTEKHKT